MRTILIIFCALSLFSCSNYDSPRQMNGTNKSLEDFQGIVLNETTIDEVYKIFNGYKISNSTSYTWTPNLPNGDKDDLRIYAEWETIVIEDYNPEFTHGNIRLDFYKDTLVQLSYRYINNKTLSFKNFKKEYGRGKYVPLAFIDSITDSSRKNSGFYCYGIENYRSFQNNNIYTLLDKDCWDITVFHMPRLKNMLSSFEEFRVNTTKNTRTNTTTNNSYTDPISGVKRNQYKGSLEQIRDLQMIDEYMKNNPDF